MLSVQRWRVSAIVLRKGDQKVRIRPPQRIGSARPEIGRIVELSHDRSQAVVGDECVPVVVNEDIGLAKRDRQQNTRPGRCTHPSEVPMVNIICVH